jgi:hypothetical protein
VGQNGGIGVKKLFALLIVLIFLAVVGGVAGMYYIRPDPTLTLNHESVPVKQKALDMVKRMSFEMVLTEEDVNNVLKQSLAQNPHRSKDVEVRGAHFTLAGDRLISDFNLLWKNRIPAGLQVTYRLAWHAPNLTATVESVKLKDFSLPNDSVENLTLPVGQELPKPLKIKDVEFGEGELKIVLQKPSLSDLKDLIG